MHSYIGVVVFLRISSAFSTFDDNYLTIFQDLAWSGWRNRRRSHRSLGRTTKRRIHGQDDLGILRASFAQGFRSQECCRGEGGNFGIGQKEKP